MIFFRKAVLIIHGFAGGTYDQEYLANYLELQKNLDIFTFTLPGHDTFFRTKIHKEDWLKSAEEHVETLISNGYRTIYVIGHSMGGVIACYIANKYKEVKKLVLAAPAFHYLALKNGKFDLLEGLKKSPELFKDYGREEIVTRILKLPARTINEFINLINEYKDIPKKINIPTLILQGENDLIVPCEGTDQVYNLIPSNNKKILYFENTNHDIFRGKRKEEIVKIVRDFLKNN